MRPLANREGRHPNSTRQRLSADARWSSSIPSPHGQSEKETSSEDEQAQAPEALEIKSAQEAHVAEVISAASTGRSAVRPLCKPAALLRRVLFWSNLEPTPGRIRHLVASPLSGYVTEDSVNGVFAGVNPDV
jgi:hypothetical protein